MKKKIVSILAAVLAITGLAMAPNLAFADGEGCESETVHTALFGEVEIGCDGEGIFFILKLILTVMTYGVGILATIGFVVSGYQYLTAKDDVSKVQKAKDRMVQIVIGLVVYAVMWSALQFLLPGGVFSGQ